MKEKTHFVSVLWASNLLNSCLNFSFNQHQTMKLYDEVPERLRGLTANQICSACVSSNLILVEIPFLFPFLFTNCEISSCRCHSEMKIHAICRFTVDKTFSKHCNLLICNERLENIFTLNWFQFSSLPLNAARDWHKYLGSSHSFQYFNTTCDKPDLKNILKSTKKFFSRNFIAHFHF